MKSLNLLIGIAAFSLVAGGALNGQGRSSEASQEHGDAAFMRQVAMGGMAEVEHGKLAGMNAASADVKQFGQRMVADHGKAGTELKTLAQSMDVALPAALDQEHQSKQDELAGLKGAAFDRAYMAHMEMAHERTVTLFQKEIKEGTAAEVKAWAQKTLPTVQEHLALARDLHAKAGH